MGELLLPSDAVQDSYWLNWYAVESRFTPGLRRYHPVDRPIQVEAYGADGNAHSLSLKTPATLQLKLDRPEVPEAFLGKPALRQLTADGWQPVPSSYDPSSKILSTQITALPVTLVAVDSSQPVAASVPDPSDPAAVQLDGGAWGVAAVDGSGNLAFWRGQGYPTRWLDPAVVEYSANTPALVRVGATLALFYAKVTGGVKQVFLRTSTDNGTSWSTPAQLSSEAVNVYQIQASSYDGTTYLFWSRQDSSTLLQYRTSTDLASWSTPATVGQPIGVLASRITPTFDIKRLNSGAWGLSWLDYHPEQPGWAEYDGIFFATSPDLSSTVWSNKQVLNPSAVGDRWPAEMSVGQTASGTIYVSFSMYDYPWDNYMFYRTSDDGGATWGPRVVYGYEPSRTPDGWQMVASHNSYLALDSYGNLRSFWDQSANSLYPTQLFFRDLAAGPITPVSTGGVVVQPAPADAPYLLPSHTVTTSRDPVITLTGSYSYSHTDLAIPGRGPSPAFARAYNSGDTRVGVLGPGWTHSYEIRLVDPGEWNGALLLVGPQGRADRYTRNADGSYTPPADSYTTLVKNADNSYTATHKDRTVWSFDSAGRLTGITDRYGNRSNLTYNANGQLSGVTDPAGRGSLSFDYDPVTGRLTGVSDWMSPARTVRYGYDGNGRLSSATDREDETTAFAYDGASQRLTTITDANGHVVVTNSYDAQGRVATQRDARGLTTGQQTTFAYVTNADGSKTTTVTYPATSLDPAWNPRVVDYYDTLGRLIKRISKPTSNSAEDIVEERGYDANSNVIWTKDGRGNRTDLAYDVDYAGQPIPGSKGNLTRRIDPAPSAGQPRPVTLYRYDSKDNLIQVIPPKGVASDANAGPTTDFSAAINLTYATDLAYEATGARLESVTRRYTDPDLGQQTAVTRYEYGDAANPGLITKVTPPRGNTGPTPDYSYATTMTYFGTGGKAGLLESTTDPLGNKTTYDYDAVGRRTSMVDPNGNASGANPTDHTWEYLYDNEDRVRFTKAPAPVAGGAQLVTEFRYDVVGNRTVVIDANGQVTKYVCDERDSLKEVHQSPNPWTDPNATPDPEIVTEYQYDHGGNLSRVIRARVDAANERATDYVYDGLNRVRKETQYPDWPSTGTTLVTQYGYDLAGNRTSLIDPLNQTTTFGYDNLNRLTSVGYSDGQTPNVSYAYDANGNRSSMADGTGTTSYSYDELDRLLAVTSPGARVVGYRYDLDGNRTRVVYPDNTAVTYSFDKGSRLESLLDWASRTVGYQYNPDGSLKQVTNVFNGTAAGYSYDNALRLTDVWNQKGANTISRHSYTLDAVGSRTRLDEVPPQLGQVGAVEPRSWAWGSNSDGEVGDGTNIYRTKPVQVTGPGGVGYLSGANTVSAGFYHSVALRSDGTVWAWGDNTYGQLGDNTNTDRATPVQVSGLTGVTAVSAGFGHSLALKDDGTVWAWGRNDGGQLGTGNTRNQKTPQQVKNLNGVIAIAAGLYHSLALKNDGTVWGWGEASAVGSTTNERTPVEIVGPGGIGYLSQVTAIAAGAHSLALRTDGTVWAWGRNDWGQLGNGTAYARTWPDQVKDSSGSGYLTGVTAIAAGDYHSLALRSDGTVWSWGRNYEYQLGDGTNTVRLLPVQVGGLSGITAIEGGGYFSFGLDGNGNPWAWGENSYGQLGDGTLDYHSRPVAVSGVTGVTSISGGGRHSLAVGMVKGDQSVSYGYDRLYRLTGATASTGSTGYSYDPAGNRLSMTAGTQTGYSYDRADRITSAGSVSYTVNANGNLVARGADSFGYDQANRLKSATVGSTGATYSYDGDGKRSSKTAGSTATNYVYDVNASLPVLLDDGARKYVWGLGLAYAVDSSGNPIVYHTDGLGSVQALTAACRALSVGETRTDRVKLSTDPPCASAARPGRRSARGSPCR